MPVKEVLLLAVTMTPGGVCLAGMTAEPDPVTGLRWVRPVRERGPVLLRDITTPGGHVLAPFDVVAFHLQQPRPQPPLAEDCIADWQRQRPTIVRRLDGERRRRFLQQYVDGEPRQVLERQERSLCLVKPDWVKGCFRLDPQRGSYEARLSFGLDKRHYVRPYAKGGLPVTDLKWRALGRSWLAEEGGWLDFDSGDLEVRLGMQEVYLAVGLARSAEGAFWPTILGVHTLPDYDAAIDYHEW